MKQQFDIKSLVENEAKRLWVAFQQKLIPHAGELGSAREQIVRDFLAQQLPSRFGVSSGFVFDVHSHVSKQMDVVVFDRQECPVFEAAGGKKFFPCEGVVCVGQIKSAITSKSQYETALENLLSAKALDRSSGGKSQSLVSGESLDPRSNHLHQIFSFVLITDRCLAERSLRRALFEHIWRHERHLWPNVTYAFNDYLTTFSCEGGICPNPMDAFAIGVLKEMDNSELFLWFSRLVAQAVSVTHVGTFSYQRYMSKAAKWSAFAFEKAPVKSPLPRHLKERQIPSWWKPDTSD